LARLEVVAAASTLTAFDDVTQLSVRAFDAQGASIATPSVQWTSSAVGIAEVSPAGVVTARGNGIASIRATAGSVSATRDIAVSQMVTTIDVSGPALIRGIGLSADLIATARDRNAHTVAGVSINWSSSAPSVVYVDSLGHVTTAAHGGAVVTAEAQGVTGQFAISVATVVTATVDPYLAAPAAGAFWEVPVVLLSYVPTADGMNLDVSQSPGFHSLDPRSVGDVESDILNIARRKKMAVEQGSRFHGYRDAGALPSIGIRVVAQIFVYDQIPGSARQYGSAYIVDYKKAFSDVGLEALITAEGVKQVWLAHSSFDSSFPSYDPLIHDLADARIAWESNMSSPTTGDISNSDRFPSDLPILGHTYVVYGINFRRSQAEAVHNVGHQLEATLSFANQRTEGNSDLFWRQFVGQDSSGNMLTGRAGWTHMPPNTTQNYDYLNSALVSSDIEDWRPDGTGAKKMVNVNTWGNLTFPWPGATDFSQRVETQWYIYWFQNMPGANNHIPRGSGEMTNWWQFMANWDAAVNTNTGLATALPAGQSIVIRNDFSGSVLIDPGGTLPPAQSATLVASVPTVVRVWDCGDPQGAGGCIMDAYTLEPGRAYRVIQDPAGPSNNLKIELQ
jgi:hypothetical protein